MEKHSSNKAIIIEAFGIRDENKTTYFRAPHDKLCEFKAAIAGSVVFRNLTDFYTVEK
jgi:hypothetical protein